MRIRFPKSGDRQSAMALRKRIRAAALGSAAVVYLVCGEAAAADTAPGERPAAAKLPLKAPAKPVPYDWTGLYFGGHFGYSRGYGRNTLLDPGPTGSKTSFGSIKLPSPWPPTSGPGNHAATS